jgi:hypothetical protein
MPPTGRAQPELSRTPHSAVGDGRTAQPWGTLDGMSTPEPANPQPRDIALEQETPDQAAELEAQSDPDPGTDES